MGGIISCTNGKVRNAVIDTRDLGRVPLPSESSPATRRPAISSGALPPPLPSRHARQSAPSQDTGEVAFEIESDATAPGAVRSTNFLTNSPRPACLPRGVSRRVAAPAMAVVVSQAEVTSQGIEDQAFATYEQFADDFNALITHPPYAAALRATREGLAALERWITADESLAAAEAQAAAYQATMPGRTSRALLAVESGHPELLEQVARDTLALQSALDRARQAHETAAAEMATSAEAMMASAEANRQLTAAMQVIQPRLLQLRQSDAMRVQAADAVLEARTALQTMESKR